ncbi:MAG: hypothetical protein H0V89_13880 [Deltaproteobacteria bacterium]|nr:hypothetical protein [Deltaproteobacteria bacterium]
MTAADPTAASITAYIRDAFPGVDVVTVGGGTFFSLNPETHWPNFATLVTTDEFDDVSNLSRPGVFRLNLGVSRSTFQSMVGSQVNPDFTALDRLVPHPVYARQLWISVLNPSAETFERVVEPLLAEAHERLTRTRRGIPQTVEAGSHAEG